jgi:hypothetical protein
MRYWIPFVAAALLAGPAWAGGEALAGQWKVTIYEDSQYLNFWLLKFTAKDGKVSGAAETLVAAIADTTVTNVQVGGDVVTFTLKLTNGIVFDFEGKLPRGGGKKILGSVTRSGNSIPAYLEATQAKNAFEANVEVLSRTPSDPRVFDTLLALVEQAKQKKAAARDVKEWVDGVLSSAENYGPTWLAEYGAKLVNALRADYAALATEAGARIDKAADGKTPPEAQLRLLGALAAAYQANGQGTEAAKLDGRMAKVEIAAHAAHMKTAPGFAVEPYSGKANQTVLVELFTGAHCKPCAAADLGFDALGKAFKGNEVVLLQYHRHVPLPDALANADVDARADFYAKTLEGTPEIYFNGKPQGTGGGPRGKSEDKYEEYRDVAEKLLKRAPGGKVSVEASRKGDVVTIRTAASLDAAAKGKIKLRLALVEDWAYYRGQSGIAFHHRVVRAMPGGAAGFAVEKELKNSVTVDVAELRTKLSKYLDDFAKKESEFPDTQRPLRLRDLHAVAFLQNDDTGEVLQAASVPVRNE